MLESLLSAEQAARFEAWQSGQREKRFQALFDQRNAPSTTELVNAIKSIDFAIDSTFEDFQEVAFRVSNTPRIPLFTTRSTSYDVQLGSSISSPRPSEPVKPSTGETVSLPNATWHKYVQAFAQDSNQTALKDPRRSFIKYGFSIGAIVAKDRYSKSAEIEDTGFVLVLSAQDHSLWMVYNCYPLDDEGDPVQFEPLMNSGRFQGEFSEDPWFNCGRLYHSVREWDPEEPWMVVFEMGEILRLPLFLMTPSRRLGYPTLRLSSSWRRSDLQQLVATPANSGHFNEFLSTLSGSQGAFTPYA